MNLLYIVQNVMSSLSLEEVNSIEEVPESIQIAEIVKETYSEILAHRERDFLSEVFSLEASGSSTLPVKMTIPSNISDVKSIKYLDEKDGKYKDVLWIEPDDFIELSNDNAGKGVAISGLVKQSDVTLNIIDTKQPEKFTSFDGVTLIFNSYNKEYDTTLMASKTLCRGTKLGVVQLEDDFEIDMPDEMIWSYLLPEVKSVANINLLQTVNSKEEQRSRRGRFRMYHAHPKTTETTERIRTNFGRK